MRFQRAYRLALCGIAAGAISGLLGTGGGMILVPLLCLLTDLPEESVFPSSVSIILPICIVSLITTRLQETPLHLKTALPYLIGGSLGGIVAALTDKKIPVRWLHRGLGILILLGGIRYLC